MERTPAALRALLDGLRVVQRVAAPFGHLLLVLALVVLPALGTSPPTTLAGAKAARPHGHTLVIRASHAGSTLVAVAERELDEEEGGAIEQPARLDVDEEAPSRARLISVDETPACLVRLLAFQIRGPPSA